MTALLVADAEYPGEIAKDRAGAGSSPTELVHPCRRSALPTFDAIELVDIADGLAQSAAAWADMRRPTRRKWKLLVASDAFEAWVIAWPPGGAIELHDHGDSAGAVAVASGTLLETKVSDGADGRLEARSAVLGAGAAFAFEAGYVHDIVNVGIVGAMSVHVYAPRLTTMTYYEVTDGRLSAGRTDHYQLGEAVP